MTTLWQDIRLGFRMIARNPGFTAVIVVILAVGIGANTAVFSVVNAVVLRPLPYKDPRGIVVLWQQTKDGERRPHHQDFLSWRQQCRVFESLAGYGRQRFYVTGIDRPREIWMDAVSSGLFPLLGAVPLLGRTFAPEEEHPGNERVVVLSHAFWQSDFGGTPEALGKIMNLDGKSYTIIGVMPPRFEWPFAQSSPFWVPLAFQPDRMWPSGRPVAAVARLKPSVTLKQARAEMAVVADRLKQTDSKAGAEWTIGVARLSNKVLKGDRKLLLLLLLGAAAFVLLIAASNVANLFLARATVRQREIAMRVALGASRGRVVRQMLTESLVLSVGAGLLGLLVTLATVKGLVHLCPADIPRLRETGVDLSVLAFTLGMSVLTGLLFGMMPAWRASDVRMSQALKEGWGRSGTGRGWRRVHGALVVSQIGLSLILLVGATLLVRSLIALQRLDLGFRPENVLATEIRLPLAKYPEPEHCTAFFDELLLRVRALPDVRSAALVSGDLQLGAMDADLSFSVPGRPPVNPEETPCAKWITASPAFLETMGIQLLRGRTLGEEDGPGTVLVDEHLARKYFPDADPIGQKLTHEEGQVVMTIVGVVSTTRDFETTDPPDGALYMRLGQSYQSMTLVARTGGGPVRLAGALRAQVAALEKDDIIVKLEPLETALFGMLAPRRFSMVLLTLFAGIALIVATVGIYGLLQYSTTQQTRDIGIRMALGAGKTDILRAVLVQGLILAGIGVVTGLAGASVLTRVLSSLLYDVTPTDLPTLVCVSLLLTGIALAASYIPARRAARIDPMVALRCE
jgi:putative ABC transport system permease protein